MSEKLIDDYRDALEQLGKGVMPRKSDIGPACNAIQKELERLRKRLARAEKVIEAARLFGETITKGEVGTGRKWCEDRDNMLCSISEYDAGNK